ncbi:MAG: M15 family metallopeptidase [Gammaproteobacteria bacterium]|nr:M15 family metallopeptidase [Gammaproteobacteria bacterium]
MSNYKLGLRSLSNLKDVDERLVAVVKRAIALTKQDFTIIEGLRTVERQQILFDSGASRTMRSKHIEGKAVDLVAYIDGDISYHFDLFYGIALAMQKASSELDIPIRWGGAWCVLDDDPDMRGKVQRYVDRKHRQHKKAFLDACHFELV